MQELDKALAEVTRGLADLTRQVGPEAAEATLKAVQIGGVLSIVGFVCGLILSGVLLWVAIRLVRIGIREERRPHGDGFGWMMGGGVVFIITLVAFVSTLDASRLSAWISAIDPAAGLAYRLLEKL